MLSIDNLNQLHVPSNWLLSVNPFWNVTKLATFNLALFSGLGDVRFYKPVLGDRHLDSGQRLWSFSTHLCTRSYRHPPSYSRKWPGVTSCLPFFTSAPQGSTLNSFIFYPQQPPQSRELPSTPLTYPRTFLLLCFFCSISASFLRLFSIKMGTKCKNPRWKQETHTSE